MSSRFGRAWAPRLRAIPRFFRESRVLVLGICLVSLFVIAAALAPQISPYKPDKVNYKDALQAPSRQHLFGTDEHGRDLFSRIVFGSRVSLKMSATAVAIAAVAGIPLGLATGYFGGFLDSVVGRISDAMFAFPGVLMAIAMTAILGPSETTVMVALGIVAIPEFTRVARSAMLAEKHSDYVEASRALGSSWPFIIFRSILPNTLGPLLVVVSLGFAFALLNATALSFLGLGAQPPTPEWGTMLNSGRHYLFEAPWYAFFPGIAIFSLVFALNLIGDGLQDLTNPRRKRR